MTVKELKYVEDQVRHQIKTIVEKWYPELGEAKLHNVVPRTHDDSDEIKGFDCQVEFDATVGDEWVWAHQLGY